MFSLQRFSRLGIPEQAVEVVIHEMPRENWGVGGAGKREIQRD
jgi:phenylpyruvate tautomerase PptA (4-oxalocrotonate tautomerase family)